MRTALNRSILCFLSTTQKLKYAPRKSLTPRESHLRPQKVRTRRQKVSSRSGHYTLCFLILNVILKSVILKVLRNQLCISPKEMSGC